MYVQINKSCLVALKLQEIWSIIGTLLTFPKPYATLFCGIYLWLTADAAYNSSIK
jgi:hypothetical protein